MKEPLDINSYFNNHCQKSMDHFNLYVKITMTSIAALGISLDQESYLLAMFLTASLCGVSWLFFQFYKRTRVLVKWAESKLELLGEHGEEAQFSNSAKEESLYKYSHNKLYTYTYILIMVFSSILFFVSLIIFVKSKCN